MKIEEPSITEHEEPKGRRGPRCLNEQQHQMFWD
jgi:hypothetical protein